MILNGRVKIKMSMNVHKSSIAFRLLDIRMKIENSEILKSSPQKVQNARCCFVALLKTIWGKNAAKYSKIMTFMNDKNMQKYRIFNFCNLVNFRHLQIVEQRCNILIFNRLENRCSIH